MSMETPSLCRLLVILTAVASLVSLSGCEEGDRAGPQDGGGGDGSSDGGVDGASSDGALGDGDATSDADLWPEPWEFHEALGDVDGIPAELRPLFVSFDVPPLPEPGPDDWLSAHDELGQTFDQFTASRPNRPTAERSVLYIQPLGDSDEFQRPTLEELELFYEAFFLMEVQTLEPIDPADFDITERAHPTYGQRQLLSTDILDLLIRRMPDDAFSLIAVTMIDLYPDDDWNFVFGQASLRYRAGVFSFARYGGPTRALELRRAFKVLAHESGHMFGAMHCIHFHCLMNGSNHLAELDAAPIHLCPVDLRKLHWSIDFDPVGRYEGLVDVYESFELFDEASWIEERLLRSGF